MSQSAQGWTLQVGDRCLQTGVGALGVWVGWGWFGERGALCALRASIMTHCVLTLHPTHAASCPSSPVGELTQEIPTVSPSGVLLENASLFLHLEVADTSARLL